MLVKLPNGVSVNPEIVKYIHIRKDRVQMDTGPRIMFIVSLKLDDGVELPVQYCDQFDIATEVSVDCTNRINKGLGVEEEKPPAPPEEEETSSDDASSDDTSSDDTSSDDASSDDTSSDDASSDDASSSASEDEDPFAALDEKPEEDPFAALDSGEEDDPFAGL